MELLTGKAKIDFNIWLIEYYIKNRKDYHKFSIELILKKHYRKTELEQNALIIEWLDNMEYKGQRFYLTFFEFNLKHKLPNWGFKEISEKAIEQCNEFYNSLELNQLP